MHFFIFGLTSWDSFPQREHGLARELATQGHDVDIIEMPGSVAGKTHGIVQRLFNPLSRDRGFARNSTPGNLRVHLPPTLPTGFRNSLTPSLDRALFRRWFTDRFSDIDMHTVTAMIMMPLWNAFLNDSFFRPARLIYDIADSLEVQSRGPGTLRRLQYCERQMEKKVTLVTYSAREMQKDVSNNFPGIPSLFLPNAVSQSFVEQVKDNNGFIKPEGTEIGYIGSTCAKWFDGKLLLAVIRAFPDFRVSVIGPVERQLAESCSQYDNVRLHGFVPHELLADYLRHFDVAIIPFRQNGITRVVNPLKLYEYTSAGIPVVATATDELKNYETIATLARNSEEFIQAIVRVIESDSTHLQSVRRRFASANTWTERVHRLIAALDKKTVVI